VRAARIKNPHLDGEVSFADPAPRPGRRRR
jgi:hypothetical protein